MNLRWKVLNENEQREDAAYLVAGKKIMGMSSMIYLNVIARA